jgi:hypothetical protein
MFQKVERPELKRAFPEKKHKSEFIQGRLLPHIISNYIDEN